MWFTVSRTWPVRARTDMGVKGSGHGLPAFGVSAAQLTHEVHFYGYLRTGTLEGIITRAHPLVPIS